MIINSNPNFGLAQSRHLVVHCCSFQPPGGGGSCLPQNYFLHLRMTDALGASLTILSIFTVSLIYGDGKLLSFSLSTLLLWTQLAGNHILDSSIPFYILFCNCWSVCRSVCPSIGRSVDQVVSTQYLLTPSLDQYQTWCRGCPQ